MPHYKVVARRRFSISQKKKKFGGETKERFPSLPARLKMHRHPSPCKEKKRGGEKKVGGLKRR